ncbi:MAG: sugar ABC transporter ATP-binding protein [Anaerolineae bacterium]|nr:sugar ABC transporter ATP-binding protein [Anaerolineae bacterium]
MNNNIILQMFNISKHFGGIQALRDVSFDLRPGEVHALLGENGAGKSTLIKIITGVYQPDTGEIHLHGQPIAFLDPLASRQRGIAAIYQEPSLFPDLDIAENIFVGRQPTRAGGRVAWRRMYREASGLLESLGVQLDPKTKARNLSVAQQQMVEIARALSVKAKILIMDEPTSSLTLAEVDDLFRIVRQLRQAGTAIVFISHRLEELFQLADRVTVLRDGAYVGTQSISEVDTDKLVQMMVGRTMTNMFPKQDVQAGQVVLRVENLTRAGIFENVSFELRQGEILGMAGLVGAGRTDVARALFGVQPATGGVIRLDGQPVPINNPRQAMDLGIVYLPEDRQHHGLILKMSITHNISLPSLPEFTRLGWVNQNDEQQAAYQAAEQMDVRAAGVWQKARELSGGNQQKVVLAKWLATHPRILILDEPTRGIDVKTKAAVHGLMSNLAAQGMAILMISSELPEVLGMSDRILVMREGHLTGHFSRAEATQEKIMLAATTAVIAAVTA